MSKYVPVLFLVGGASLVLAALLRLVPPAEKLEVWTLFCGLVSAGAGLFLWRRRAKPQP